MLPLKSFAGFKYFLVEKISKDSVFDTFCITHNSQANEKLYNRIEKIIKEIRLFENPKSIKFGKTGDELQRILGADYTDSGYTKMFILCESRNKEFIDNLEVYFINRHWGDCDNTHRTIVGNMTDTTGLYKMYLVL